MKRPPLASSAARFLSGDHLTARQTRLLYIRKTLLSNSWIYAHCSPYHVSPFMRRFLLILSACFLTLASASATDAVYLNRGVVTNVNVDAFSFVNQGRFLVESIDIPWQSQS